MGEEGSGEGVLFFDRWAETPRNIAAIDSAGIAIYDKGAISIEKEKRVVWQNLEAALKAHPLPRTHRHRGIPAGRRTDSHRIGMPIRMAAAIIMSSLYTMASSKTT